MTAQAVNTRNFMTFDVVLPSLQASTQKNLLQQMARSISPLIGMNEKLLFDRLMFQEAQTSSAIGAGVGIMHLHLSSLQSPLNIFVRLQAPIDMASSDNQLVDLFCLQMTPEREGVVYLQSLAKLSRFLRNANTLIKLRAAKDERAIRGILEQLSIQNMAA